MMRSLIRFHSAPIYAIAIDEDSRGRIDTVMRKYEYSLRQIKQEFDVEKVFTEDELMGMSKDPNFKFEIIHEVSPRSKEERKGKLGSLAFPYRSCSCFSPGPNRT